MPDRINDADIERIAEALAPKLIAGVKDRHHDFWIDPETHYQDHISWRQLSPDEIRSLKDLVKMFLITRGLFWKAFLGAAIVGTLVLSAIGMGFNKT